MSTARIFPINWKTGAGGAISDTDTTPKAAMQSITMSLRFGDHDMAIGYIQSFNWSMERTATPYHQIEAYPDGTFGGGSIANAEFTSSFYWPGEPVEVIPGKVGGIQVTLSKIAFYSANLLRTLMKIQGAGTEEPNGSHGISDNSLIHYTGPLQNEYVSTIQQVRPIYIKQIFLSPTTGVPVFGRVFEECWFTNIAEVIPDAATNGAIIENGTLMATRMRPYVRGTGASAADAAILAASLAQTNATIAGENNMSVEAEKIAELQTQSE